MSVAAVEPLTILAGFLIGCFAAAALLGIFVVAPARRDRATIAAAGVASDAELVRERIAAATLRSDLSAALDARDALRATLADTTAKRDRCEMRNGELERQLASVQATLEQMKLGEEAVDARLQRVAGIYVAEAREALVKAAADRFQGDATAFREKLVASVAPLSERLESLGKSLVDLGTARTADQERVATLLAGLDAKMAGIDDATRRVERVLGNSQARGSWGEFELTRLLELTGMTEHVSFDTQEAGYGADASGRPDVVLHIPGNLIVPIDAKVPFARYQDAVAAHSEAEREPLLDAAVAAIRSHVKVLGARKYHERPDCVGWTIMFVPIEAMLATLFARDHEIFEAARASRVLIASPLTLMLYLEAFSRGWAAQKQSENASVILEEARVLVNRLTTFTEKFGKVGTSLDGAVQKYNEAVASFEGRLAPQARKIGALRGDPDETVRLPDVTTTVRALDPARLPTPRLALEAS